HAVAVTGFFRGAFVGLERHLWRLVARRRLDDRRRRLGVFGGPNILSHCTFLPQKQKGHHLVSGDGPLEALSFASWLHHPVIGLISSGSGRLPMVRSRPRVSMSDDATDTTTAAATPGTGAGAFAANIGLIAHHIGGSEVNDPLPTCLDPEHPAWFVLRRPYFVRAASPRAPVTPSPSPSGPSSPPSREQDARRSTAARRRGARRASRRTCGRGTAGA